MRKIGITCYPTVGGSGVIATELGVLLAERGYEVHFITSSLPFRLNHIHPKIYYHEVELNHYPVFQYPPYDLALASKMAEVVDQEELDVLHVHYAMPHAICAILAKQIAKRDVKIVTTLHGTDITVLGIDQTFQNIIRHGIEQSDAVTAVSENLVKQTNDRLGIKQDISVIYNFVNEQVYYKRDVSEVRKQYAIRPDEKVLIHISNFRKVKRVPDIIRAFHLIVQKQPAKLLLVGDGPEYSVSRQLVNELGLQDNVLFLGQQKNVSELLSLADLNLLLSEKESFGLVLLEAMSCEVPAIGTNTGGIPEVIAHGETGYVVDVGAYEQAAVYALNLLQDGTKLQQFSKAAFDRARTLFLSDKIVSEYADLYDHIL